MRGLIHLERASEFSERREVLEPGYPEGQVNDTTVSPSSTPRAPQASRQKGKGAEALLLLDSFHTCRSLAGRWLQLVVVLCTAVVVPARWLPRPTRRVF